jgi:hypothetical protein
MFTPGPTTLSGPFRGLPGWRRTSSPAHGLRPRARYPTVIFNRGCGAKKGRGKPPHCLKKGYVEKNKHDGYLID